VSCKTFGKIEKISTLGVKKSSDRQFFVAVLKWRALPTLVAKAAARLARSSAETCGDERGSLVSLSPGE